MSDLAGYIETRSGDDCDYTPLKSTGRWKLVTSATKDNQMYIEHRVFFIFRFWINEDSIVIRPARRSRVFNCSKR